MSEVARLFQQLSQHQPVDVELLFPNLSFRRGKEGPIHCISVEVTEEVWTAFKHLPGNIRLGARLVVIADDETGTAAVEAPTLAPKPKKEPKPKGPWGFSYQAPKGPWGYFWEALHHDGFYHHPDVRQWITERDTLDRSTFTKPSHHDAADKQVFCDFFQVESRAFIAPVTLRDAACRNFPGAVPLIEQAERKAEENAQWKAKEQAQ